MSYIHKKLGSVLVGAGTAKVTTATGVSVHSIAVLDQIKVDRIAAVVSTAIDNDLVAAVMTVKRRPTYGSTAGEVSIGTLTFPDGTAAGKVLYKDVNPVVCYPGDQIVFEITTAGTDGAAAAGAAIGMVSCEEDPEVPGNQGDMVASA